MTVIPNTDLAVTTLVSSLSAPSGPVVPVLTASGPVDVSVLEDSKTVVDALVNAVESDPTLPLLVTFGVAALPAGVSFDPTALSFVIDTTVADYQALAAGETTTITVDYIISDGTNQVPTSLKLTITGTNDIPVVSGAFSGMTQEDSSIVASGKLTASDVDHGQSGFAAAGYLGQYGTLSVDIDGNWTYALDNTLPAVQGLDLSAKLLDTVTIATLDGTPVEIKVSILGMTDAPAGSNLIVGTAAADNLLGTTGSDAIYGLGGNDILAGDAGNDFIDGGLGRDQVSGGAGDDTILVGGGTNGVRLTPSDSVDGGTGFDTVVFEGLSTDYKATHIGGTNFTQVVNLTTAQRFIVADVERLSFADTSIDLVPSGKQITVTTAAANGVEDGASVAIDLLAGAISPYGDPLKVIVDPLTLPSGVSFDAATGLLSLDPASPSYQALRGGEVTAVLVDYTVTDGNRSTTSTASFTITGVNDAAVITGDVAGSVTEDIQLVTTGHLSVQDVDHGESNFAPGGYTGLYGTLSIDAAGNWNYVLDNSLAAVQALVTGEKVVDVLQIHSLDGTTADISIAVNGQDEVRIVGTNGDDNLHGTVGNDIIDGLLGRDTMAGDLGDDTYYVDNSKDVVIEQLNAGRDTVISTVSHTLSANVEDLVLAGVAAINGTGNALANTMTGNDAANTLNGKDGDDWISGGAGNDHVNGGNGNDYIDGGVGADVLNGGAGNDTFVVDNARDEVIGGSGIDLVLTSLSSYKLQSDVENLTYTGTSSFTGSGNSSANTITGSIGSDNLNGGDGSDHLNGGQGADILTGGAGNDVFVFIAGQVQSDMVTDYSGAGARFADVLQFEGYGHGTVTAAVTAGHYLVTADAAHGAFVEEFILQGVNNLDLSATSNDFIFMA